MLRKIHRARNGIATDAGLFLVGAGFAWFTAAASTLPAHRAWGQIAAVGYAVAAALAVVQLMGPARLRSAPARTAVLCLGWLGSTLVPLVVQAVQRAGGHPHRAQEEVAVVEMGATRLLDSGTPYLTRDGIAATPEPLLGYLPYQPGMTVFGLPRALAGDFWWADARIWFALGTGAALLAALRLLHGSGVRSSLLVRAAQAITVLPICALTLATGGDDLPVVALTVLALAYAAQHRWVGAGVVIGLAAALKLLAWPVAVVLVIHGYAQGRQAGARMALPAVAIPVGVLLPVTLLNGGSVAENLIRFPLGMGLVKSPAASPLPGHLIATGLPFGRAVAAALLVTAAAMLGVWLLRRPPTTASAAAAVCALGLLVAILLMPATRFGYLLYPAGYAVWAVALGQLTGTREPAVPSNVA